MAMRKYWDEKYETMRLEEMQEFQLEKLKETVNWVYERIPFYKNSLDEKGIKPDDIHSLEDIVHLPFTVKTDLRDHYPLELFAVSMNEVARVHASSGTTGKPIIGPYTQDDLEQWTECTARIFWAQGIRPDDICQNAVPYGLFTGGAGCHQGLEKIGCTIIPVSGGMTERQIVMMQDLSSTVFLATPSYGMTLVERAEKMGVDIRSLPLRIAVFGAEPWTLEMMRELEERLGATCHEMFGLTELMGPGVSGSCEAKRLHINEDHIYPEIVDPETERPLPDGEQGELVFTALQRRAAPAIRYKTRDISTLRRDRCECGRTLVTMDRIRGRADDMLIVTGVNVFPSQIESLILEFNEVEPHYQIRVFKKGHLTKIAVELEAKRDIYLQSKEKISELERRISGHLQQRIGIQIPVTILDAGTIPRSEGKAKRVIDETKK